MKTLKHLLTALLLMVATVAMAHDFEVDGICYNITDATNKTVEVTYGENNYTGSVAIPAVVSYNNVSYSVTSIGNSAFSGCESLTSIEIPNSVTSIGEWAFNRCFGLTSITLPEGITSIGNRAFGSCESLTSIIIPKSVTSIEAYTFTYCESLTNITIPEGVISIGECAFYYCSSLTSITIPNSVRSIEAYAFSGCGNLTSITIPYKVKSIRNAAFSHCTKLESIIVDNNNSIYDSRNGCNAIIETESNTIILGCKNTTIPNSVTSIGDGAFCGNSNLTSITIPNSVTSIGNSAFSQCYNLKSITIPNSVTSIEPYVFNECSKLKSIDIPNSVTSIGNRAFCCCESLTSIEIPNSVTSIEDYAFYGCINLTNLTIGNGLTIIPERAFSACRKLASIEIPHSVQSIGGHAFSSCNNVTKITIGDGVERIGNYAFDGCGKLEILIIGKSVYDIGRWTFNDSHNIKTVINLSSNPDICSTFPSYPDKVINAPGGAIERDYVFYKTSGVNTLIGYFGNDIEISLPKDYQGESYAIGSHAFDGCYNLASIEIPSNITAIGQRAFEETTWYDNQPNGLMYAGNVLYKYKGKMAEDTEVVIKEGTLGIAGGAFNNCLNLKSIIIPNTLKFIGENAFYGCDNIGMIECRAEIPPICDTKALDGINKQDCILLVPYKSAYKNVEQWKDFLNIKGTYTEKFTVTFIVDGEVYDTLSVEYGEKITLPETPVKEGHTFSGWSEAPETMPAEDITIEGAFSVNSYTITYKVDGEIYATDSIAYGSEIVLRDEPVKEGHTFSGWSGVPETMPAEDIVIEGSFSVNSYTITYKVDGEVYATDSIAYGSEIVLRDGPVKEGHTFSGWSEAPETMPAEDITIEGAFSVNSYTITYKVDGEIYATDSIAYGSEIVLRDEPVKEGHTFSGWSEAPETMPAEDITIEGSFSVNSYTITYKVDGEVYATDSIAYGSEIVLRDEPVKEGHTFSGWSEAPETMPAEDITIEGTFSVNSYTITYKVDGEVYATDSIAYGSEIVLRDEPVKEGHTFSGWSEVPETMPAEDITITGSFEVNTYAVTYIVDGEVYATDSVAYGSEIVLRDEPAKEGHTFSGWSEAPATMPAEDITITGSFDVNTYAVTYIVDGEVYATDSVAYGSEIVLRDEPAKEGHTFSGWSEVPETMPAEDITITGSFEVNTYAVTYIVDGEVYATDSIAYGSEIVLRDEPTKEGHTFSGWSEVPETMPAEDIVIEGSFSVNSYTITYKVDGEVYETITAEYGTAIEPIEEPAKEGHTFSGWSDMPETMPAEDITVEGTFSINSYTVTFMIDGEVYETTTVEFGAEIELPTPPEKEGHTFSGWSEVPETMPAEDIVIEGEYIVDTTGINDLKAENGKVKGVYDLQGRKVDNPTNGIYIVNGKKVFIK